MPSGMATRYLTYVIVPLCEKEPYEENICFIKIYILFQKTYILFKKTYVIVMYY